MARTWVILGRVLRPPLLANAAAGGEGEADSEAERDAEAHGVAAEEVEAADAQAAAPDGADFSIPLAEPPRITVMTAAPTAHPFPEYPDKAPYILCVDSGCILLNFGVDPFKGACFDDRPYQSNLIVVRDFNWAGVEQGHPITATAERIPPRDGQLAIVCNVESIGIIYDLDPDDDYIIAELMIDQGPGRERATLLYFYAGLHSNWIQEFTDSPLPLHESRHREWIPSGVVSYNKMLWWFDLSWGIISYDPVLVTPFPLLLFHRLPEGQDLNKAQRGMHDSRCIAVSVGCLRYVAITPDGDAATVSMWTRVRSAHAYDGTGWLWEEEFTVSFAEIWDHDSYRATGLPRKVPVLVTVCPSNANMVYFAMEDPKRLFGVNMYPRRVEEFIDEPYEVLTPWLDDEPPSCRYVLPWCLPLEVAQALGEDPLAGDAEDEELIEDEELQEEEGEDEEQEEQQQQVAEIDEEEPPVDESEEEPPVDESSDEAPFSVAMDPATLARLKSEMVYDFAEESHHDFAESSHQDFEEESESHQDFEESEDFEEESESHQDFEEESEEPHQDFEESSHGDPGDDAGEDSF